MPDNPLKKRPQDSSRINLNEPWEVAYWCDHLSCTEAQLRAAVATVGTSVQKVREYLKK